MYSSTRKFEIAILIVSSSRDDASAQSRSARGLWSCRKVTERKLNVEARFHQPRREAQTAALIQQGSIVPRVESSMMTRVQYDEDARELDIVFATGKTYRYLDVPPEIYIGLLGAESKGKFFNEEIKDVFAYVEVVKRRR